LRNSEGTPNQSFRFLRTPVLDGQKIAVLEKDKPSEDEIIGVTEESGEGSMWEDKDGNGWWVVWKETESLYDSDSKSRHYTKEIVSGEIKFGDGMHGMIPPKGDRNVRAFFYQVGGGEEGNLSGNTLTVLKQSIAFIEGVANNFPASGGSNLESIEEVKMRGPHLIKSRDRAVTAEDFEWLAVQSTNSVARVKCLPSTEREGEVTVIVVPRVAEGSDAFYSKLIPSTEILRRVKNYLNDRKLVSSIVNITGPKYRNFSIKVEIIRLSGGTGEKVKKEIQGRLRLFLHPLCGGKNKKGWQFGRAVFKADLYHVVEDVEGVDFVDSIRLYDLQTGAREVDLLKINDNELPYLVEVEVFEKQHERII
ncbi:MAG: putative baseplate assembly protein, partial [Deltaproteobacteria bacterium]|nr:putative baseplate assembly protein [Deltaproteobacteria bacterium]